MTKKIVKCISFSFKIYIMSNPIIVDYNYNIYDKELIPIIPDINGQSINKEFIYILKKR